MLKQNHNINIYRSVQDPKQSPQQLELFPIGSEPPDEKTAQWEINCPHCGYGLAVETHSSKPPHFSKLSCQRCGRWLRWVRHSESKLPRLGGES